jgi:shikimate dehydrogenase
MTKRSGLIGNPVDHSLSPVMQAVAFRETGIDGSYELWPTEDADVPSRIASLRAPGMLGGNVTVPHKQRAMPEVDELSNTALRIGAVNTIINRDGRLLGDNTDAYGFAMTVRGAGMDVTPASRALVLGAGGAARAVLLALVDEGVKDITLYNRTVERARAVSRRIGGERVRVVSPVEELNGGEFDLVVNSTRLGLDPNDPLPLDLTRLERVGAVLDLVYGDEPTRFVQEARRYGVPATDGGEMLVQQGAVSFERWWDTEAPLDAMRAALENRKAPVG